MASQTHGSQTPQQSAPLERSIAHRPAEVETRQRFGHWDCDLVIFSPQFGKSNITSFQEHQSRYHILIANEERRSAEVISRIATVLGKFPHHACRTITFGRGTEFLSYKNSPLDSYFCNPHSPWQKGGVENANGRLRRYLPLDIPVADGLRGRDGSRSPLPRRS